MTMQNQAHSTPTEIAARFAGMEKLTAIAGVPALRSIDAAPQSGAGVAAPAALLLFGEDRVDRLIQLDVVIRGDNGGRAEALDAGALLARAPEGWVMVATHDPEAVAALIHLIMTGGEASAVEFEGLPLLPLRGSGHEEEVEISDVVIEDATRQRSYGHALINGEDVSFYLRLPNLPSPARSAGQGHTTAKLRLTGTLPAGEEVVVAELSLHGALG